MASLTELHLESMHLPLGFTRPLLHLPNLRTLGLHCCELADDETLDGLPLLPHLTHLNLYGVQRINGELALYHASVGRLYASIGQCRRLTRLELDQALLDDPSFARLLHSSPLAATLQHLSLLEIGLTGAARTLSPESLAALQSAFEQLRSLRQLSLLYGDVQLAHLLLHVVRRLPLERLELAFMRHEAHLSPAALQQLLAAAPCMHLTYWLDRSPHSRHEYQYD